MSVGSEDDDYYEEDDVDHEYEDNDGDEGVPASTIFNDDYFQ